MISLILGVNRNTRQSIAVPKCANTNGSHAIGDRDARQAAATPERPLSNGNDAIGNHNACQAAAPLERSVANGRNRKTLIIGGNIDFCGNTLIDRNHIGSPVPRKFKYQSFRKRLRFSAARTDALYIVMPEGNNFHRLTAEFFTAYGAIDDLLIRAARRAGRSHFVLFDRLARRMPESFDLLRLFLAAGTDPLTQALFGASRLGDNFQSPKLCVCPGSSHAENTASTQTASTAESSKMPSFFISSLHKISLYGVKKRASERRHALHLRYLRLSPNNFQNTRKRDTKCRFVPCILTFNCWAIPLYRICPKNQVSHLNFAKIIVSATPVLMQRVTIGDGI